MNRIKELREDRDLRQIDVSLATGIDQRTLSNYETGKTNPDSFAIVKLAEFFDVSADYLLCIEKKRGVTVNDLMDRISRVQAELLKISRDLKKI